MKYAKGKERSKSIGKYIIDVGEGYTRHGLERTLTIPVRINEHEDHWMDTRIPVTPYTEPDLDAIRTEAYEKGVQDTKQHWVDAPRTCAYKCGYENGLNDAWKCARKIGSESMYGLEKMGFDFSQCVIADYNPSWFVVKNYSASECIEKIRQYEQRQEGFHVGDEFENESGKKFVVLKMNGKEIDRYIDGDGKTYVMDTKYSVIRKTGRHFPEIAAVLEKMRGESND